MGLKKKEKALRLITWIGEDQIYWGDFFSKHKGKFIEWSIYISEGGRGGGVMFEENDLPKHATIVSTFSMS